MKTSLLFAAFLALIGWLPAAAQTPGATFGLFGFASMTTGTTGGAGGTSVTVNTGTALQNAIKTKGAQPLTIYVNGPITLANSPGLSKIDVKDVSNLSIIGFDRLGEFNGIGIKVFRASNIIIQNVKVHNVLAGTGDGDCIGIEGPADHVWVDHCEMYNVYQGVGTDDYDGLLDAKADCQYITYSWNYLHDGWKASLCGFTETDNFDRKITYHHNRFENINSRLPLFRFGTGHVFNNYYKDIASTCVNSRMGACLKIENNYFENARNPYVAAYSPQDGFGDISGNTLVNSPFVYASDVHVLTACTLAIPYAYSGVLNAAPDVPAIVLANAGIGKVGPTLAPGTFAVTASALGQGTVAPASGTYALGQSVTLTATPATGWQFAGWSGDTTATTNPLTFRVKNSKVLRATFTLIPGTGAAGPLIRIEDTNTPLTGLCSFDGAISQNTGADNGAVINLSNSAAKAIVWKVEVTPAGAYELKWRYTNSSASSGFTGKLVVNGVVVNAAAPFPRTANSTTFALATQNVTLDNGVNEIRLETTTAASFADIDWLEITGNRIVPTNCANAVGTIQVLAARQSSGAAAPQAQAFPNPMAGSVTFDVTQLTPGPVRIVLYSTSGAKVAEVATGRAVFGSGTHRFEYQNAKLPAGLYFYEVTTTGGTYREKLQVE
ncbi:pectate lyase family protein [Hymenobacter armeniacus]|uniref:T9SS type A sorting domain-containing protein n=1 Tax=Hymenobacter armeniacus TaxID=2771358 RepID=A0ABR8JWY4_9BACT|nr:T9SS type A sorting domain-containing protein [Hymenobacter armeniacus]MBD2723062.1 T9SS type A sorting domain-containing protein [Hymenobacter armeniacus]